MTVFNLVDSFTPFVRKNARIKMIIIAGKLTNVPFAGSKEPETAFGI